MMKKISILLTTLGVLVAITCGAKKKDKPQHETKPTVKTSILLLKEIDPNGREIPIRDNYRVIDPNSTIEIQIDGKTLMEHIPVHDTDKKLTERLTFLKDMLKSETEAMKTLSGAIADYNHDRKDWGKKMGLLFSYVSAILDNNETNMIYEKEFPETKNMDTMYINLFKAAGIAVDRLEVDMKALARKNGVYIMLGAWMEGKNGTRSVHIPGYDDYTAEPSYHVEQFVMVLSDEQKKQLTEIAALASDANRDGLDATLFAQSAVKRMLPGIMGLSSLQKAKELDSFIKTKMADVTLHLGAAKETLEQINNEFAGYEQYLKSKVKKYDYPQTENRPGDLLLGINADIDDIIKKTTELDTKLKESTDKLQIQLSTLTGTTKSAVDSIKTRLTNLTGSIKTDIEGLRSKAKDALKKIIAGEEFRVNSYEFTEKVKKLVLDNIPKTASLDLETTGKRDIGDKVILKLAVGSANAPLRELEARRYHLYFCTPFVRTTVGFLFTDPSPLFQRENNKALYHYAPSYSILMKGIWKSKEKSRERLGYHRLWSPGIGINVAALDFNSDGAMEVGLGGVFALFNDFIQIGYGANMYDGNGYSFIGLKIPVGSLGLR